MSTKNNDPAFEEFDQLVHLWSDYSVSEEKGQRLLELFPAVSKAVQRKHEKKVFFVLEEWKFREFETVQKLTPYLEIDPMLFLWEHAIRDFNSDNDELVYHSQTRLERLVGYLPLNKREDLISQELISKMLAQQYPRSDKIASLLVAKAESFHSSKRVELQLSAFEGLFRKINDEHSHIPYYVNDQLSEWLREKADLLEPPVISQIWKDCCEKAETGMPSEKPDFFELVLSLAKVMPAENIRDACLDCYKFHQYLWYLNEPANIIAVLISRSPKSEQLEQWRKIFTFLLTEPQAENSHVKPLKLAGLLTYKMPEPLQEGAFNYYYEFVRGVTETTDTTFERLWRNVNL